MLHSIRVFQFISVVQGLSLEHYKHNTHIKRGNGIATNSCTVGKLHWDQVPKTLTSTFIQNLSASYWCNVSTVIQRDEYNFILINIIPHRTSLRALPLTILSLGHAYTSQLYDWKFGNSRFSETPVLKEIGKICSW